MSVWNEDELKRIASTDDLHISPFREDGVTYGTPTWIWSVVAENELYVQSYNGFISMVQVCNEAEGRSHRRGWDNERGLF